MSVADVPFCLTPFAFKGLDIFKKKNSKSMKNCKINLHLFQMTEKLQQQVVHR